MHLFVRSSSVRKNCCSTMNEQFLIFNYSLSSWSLAIERELIKNCLLQLPTELSKYQTPLMVHIIFPETKFRAWYNPGTNASTCPRRSPVIEVRDERDDISVFAKLKSFESFVYRGDNLIDSRGYSCNFILAFRGHFGLLKNSYPWRNKLIKYAFKLIRLAFG